MLVFSRIPGQSLMLGDDIEVHVVEIRGDKVRLGIVCSAETSVHRREVLDAIQRQSDDSTETPGRQRNEP